MTNWRPMESSKEQPGKGCQKCGSTTGRSIDSRGRIYCPAHRDEHNK